MTSSQLYRKFLFSLLRNYMIGSVIAVLGVGGTVIFSTLSVSRQDSAILLTTLMVSLFVMLVVELVVFLRHLAPIRAAFLSHSCRLHPAVEAISLPTGIDRSGNSVHATAYLRCQRLPILAVARTMGPHWLGFLIPGVIISAVEIHRKILALPMSYVGLAALGTLIVALMHALIEFFLTTRAIQPVLRFLSERVQGYQATVSDPATTSDTITANSPPRTAEQRVIVSVRQKFLLSTVLIGTLPLLLFTLATQVRFAGDPVSGLAYIRWAIIILFLGVCFAVISAWLLANDIIHPISNIASLMSDVEQGNFSVRADNTYSDEFARLVFGFNHMVMGLNERDRTNKQLIESYFATLSAALDARDPYTAGHSLRVADNAVHIGRSAGLDEEALALLRQSALLHDIGKIGIRDDILLKNGKLSDEEFQIIKRHPVIGEAIIQQVQPASAMQPLLPGIRSHHERYDGRGYPGGLTGEAIPLFGRIIAVADAYDAMTSNRTYRGAMSDEKALAILIEGKGTQWDPFFVDCFVRFHSTVK